jgi:hypothetical protein
MILQAIKVAEAGGYYDRTKVDKVGWLHHAVDAAGMACV